VEQLVDDSASMMDVVMGITMEAGGLDNLKEVEKILENIKQLLDDIDIDVGTVQKGAATTTSGLKKEINILQKVVDDGNETAINDTKAVQSNIYYIQRKSVKDTNKIVSEIQTNQNLMNGMIKYISAQYGTTFHTNSSKMAQQQRFGSITKNEGANWSKNMLSKAKKSLRQDTTNKFLEEMGVEGDTNEEKWANVAVMLANKGASFLKAGDSRHGDIYDALSSMESTPLMSTIKRIVSIAWKEEETTAKALGIKSGRKGSPIELKKGLEVFVQETRRGYKQKHFTEMTKAGVKFADPSVSDRAKMIEGTQEQQEALAEMMAKNNQFPPEVMWGEHFDKKLKSLYENNKASSDLLGEHTSTRSDDFHTVLSEAVAQEFKGKNLEHQTDLVSSFVEMTPEGNEAIAQIIQNALKSGAWNGGQLLATSEVKPRFNDKNFATAVEQLGANARDIGTLISFFKANPNIVGLSKQRTAVMHVSAEDSAKLFTEEEAVENAKKFKSDNFSKSLAEMAGKSGLDSELSDKLILSMRALFREFLGIKSKPGENTTPKSEE